MLPASSAITHKIDLMMQKKFSQLHNWDYKINNKISKLALLEIALFLQSFTIYVIFFHISSKLSSFLKLLNGKSLGKHARYYLFSATIDQFDSSNFNQITNKMMFYINMAHSSIIQLILMADWLCSRMIISFLHASSHSLVAEAKLILVLQLTKQHILLLLWTVQDSFAALSGHTITSIKRQMSRSGFPISHITYSVCIWILFYFTAVISSKQQSKVTSTT